MNVACPQCTSVFRVDPAKVPAGGVRARCSVCSGVINVPEPAFEEPVTSSGAGGWSGPVTPAWGRVATPEGGWTPPPSMTPVEASPPHVPRTPVASERGQPPGPFIPPTPPPPAESQPTQSADWGTLPPEDAQGADWGGGMPAEAQREGVEKTPAEGPTPAEGLATDWGTTSAADSADWGDWPGPGHQLGATAASEAAAAGAAVDPWGESAMNPLAPERAPAAEQYPTEPAEADYDEAEPVHPPYHAAEVQADDSASPPYGTATPYEPVATPAPAPEASPSTPAPAPTEGQHVNPFMRRDPHERARRLARALASDIVTYYPDRHAEGMRDGTLRELFREEIKKSYDDYVAHVGAEVAQSTTYFQDALNEVLAGGKRLF